MQDKTKQEPSKQSNSIQAAKTPKLVKATTRSDGKWQEKTKGLPDCDEENKRKPDKIPSTGSKTKAPTESGHEVSTQIRDFM